MGQITLPTRMNFQVSPGQMEYAAALSKLYTPPVPRPFFYPRSPYAGGSGVGMKGMGGDVLTYDGCVPYDYYGFLEAFRQQGLIHDCGLIPFGDPQAQYACVQANQPTLNLIQSWAGTCISPSQVPANYVPTPGSSGDPSPAGGGGLIQWTQNGPSNVPVPTGGGTSTTTTGTGGGGVPATSYSPRVTFTASRQGTLYPGDTWQISITGGKPLTTVSVNGTHNGVMTPNTMGPTDANGSYSLSGTIDNVSGGSWVEEWFVGGQSAGSFSFQVGTPAGSTTPGGSPGATTGGSNSGSALPGPSTSGTATAGELIPGVPNTYLMLGVGGALLLMMMGGRR